MTCLICSSNKIEEQSSIVGLDGLNYQIARCTTCGSSFVSEKVDSKSAHESAYEGKTSSGYDRYFEIFKNVKAAADPLIFLAKQQPEYLSIINFLRGKQGLKILEVGCGLGYLTYSLNCLGHSARGIDISSNSIDLARKELGEFFSNLAVEDLEGEDGSFDLIIATELIEHLKDPGGFLNKCQKLLNHGGSLILTTPNKDYYGNDYLWNTELPPLHLSWIGKNGLQKMAEGSDFAISFFDYLKEGVANFESNNLMTDFIFSRKLSYSSFCCSSSESKKRKSTLRMIFVDFAPVRILMNRIYSFLNRGRLDKYVIISAILKKG